MGEAGTIEQLTQMYRVTRGRRTGMYGTLTFKEQESLEPPLRTRIGENENES